MRVVRSGRRPKRRPRCHPRIRDVDRKIASGLLAQMVGLREPVMALAPRLRCELWRRSLAEVVDASVVLVLPLAPMGLALWVTGSASVAEFTRHRAWLSNLANVGLPEAAALATASFSFGTSTPLDRVWRRFDVWDFEFG
jgi:hypothetical protein